MSTAKGITYFRIENMSEVLSIEYFSWRSELNQERPDIVSDIVESDDIEYDFFYYIYALWLDSGFRNQTCLRWMERMNLSSI